MFKLKKIVTRFMILGVLSLCLGFIGSSGENGVQAASSRRCKLTICKDDQTRCEQFYDPFLDVCIMSNVCWSDPDCQPM